MGEGVEEKKPEEKKLDEEGKAEEKAQANEPQKPAEQEKEEKKNEETKIAKESKDEAPATPPPQEIVLKVFMHCEGCARKVRSSLKGFEGVEDVITDCKNQKVIVMGEKADPLKVLERVQRKSHRRVELLSPIPKPPAAAEEEKKTEEAPKPEEKKEEFPVILVVLKVHMHCEACAQELKKRILRIKGVESAMPDLKSSEVTVKGVFEPSNLVKYLYKRTGKHAVIVKQELEKTDKAEESKESKEDKKVEDGEDGGDKDKKDGSSGEVGGEVEEKAQKKEADGEAKPDSSANTVETKLMESKKNEFVHLHPDYSVRFVDTIHNLYPPQPQPPLPLRYVYPGYDPPLPHPPQMFSDENPNACSVM